MTGPPVAEPAGDTGFAEDVAADAGTSTADPGLADDAPGEAAARELGLAEEVSADAGACGAETCLVDAVVAATEPGLSEPVGTTDTASAGESALA